MDTVTCVVESRDTVGESPIWSASEQALYWMDVRGRTVRRWHPASGARRDWALPDFGGCLALRRGGGFVVALRSGFHFLDPDSGATTPIVDPEADLPDNRFNDGKCDRAGRLWAGTMQNNFGDDGSDLPITRASGYLYRLDPDLACTRMEGPISIANTVAWSPDDRTMYFGCSLAETIYAYDFDLDSGTITNQREFLKLEGKGLPDGSTVDAEGYLWNVRVNYGSVVRVAPDGSIDLEIPMPVTRPTSCIFGGPDLSTLYVTSASDELTAEQLAAQPQAGCVFAIETGIRGLPEPTFAG